MIRATLACSRGRGRLNVTGDARNEWNIRLDDEPTAIRVQIGAGGGDLDLDG